MITKRRKRKFNTTFFYKKWASYRLYRKQPPRIVNRSVPKIIAISVHTVYRFTLTSPWARFKLTTLVVMGTDCISSCKSNYHKITITSNISQKRELGSWKRKRLNFCWKMRNCRCLQTMWLRQKGEKTLFEVIEITSLYCRWLSQKGEKIL